MHGKATDPESVLCLKAILAACEDAGIDPRDIDGFSSYSNDRNDPPTLATALGTHELRYSTMLWGGGGGGGAGAMANAAAAVATGLAECVVVYRALAQGQFGRFGQGMRAKTVSGDLALTMPYGQMSPALWYAPKAMRFMHEHNIDRRRSARSPWHPTTTPRRIHER